MPAQPLPTIDSLRSSPRICPQLGLFDDPATRYGFPSPGNFCHKLGEPQALSISAQVNRCLNEGYRGCPLWLSDGQTPPPRPARSKRLILPFILITLLIVAVAATALLILPGLLKPAVLSVPLPPSITATTHKASSTALPVLAVPPSQTASPTSTPTQPRPTNTPQPSTAAAVTASPTRGPYPGTPFGPDSDFLIYIVQEGDNLTSIAATFETTPQVILSSNVFKDGRAMWAGDLLVIMPGVTNPDEVTPYLVVELAEDTPIEALASQYGTTIQVLQSLNSLGVGSLVPAGRMLIIPAP